MTYRRLPSTLLAAVVIPVGLVLVGCAGDDEASIAGPGSGPTTSMEPDGTVPSVDDGDSPDDGQPVARRMERTIFELVNAERAERGIPPLEWDERLAEEARSWSREMADRGRLQHQDTEQLLAGLEGLDAVGENIFQSTGPVPAGQAHVGWMRSDSHRPNVLDEAFDRLGIGVFCGDDGATWATQRFGSTRGGAVPDPDRDVPPEQPIVGSDDQGSSCADGP